RRGRRADEPSTDVHAYDVLSSPALTIDVSTSCPSPVRARWYSAWMTAIADRNPLPVSPNDVNDQNGVPPAPTAPSSHSTPVSAAPVWSLPGQSARDPACSNPRVWQYTIAGFTRRSDS